MLLYIYFVWLSPDSDQRNYAASECNQLESDIANMLPFTPAVPHSVRRQLARVLPSLQAI